MLTEEQKANWAQLIEFLRTLSDDRYSHAQYRVSNPCGTQCCALGWARELNIGGLRMWRSMDTHPGWAIGTDVNLSAHTASARVFGEDSYNEVFNLFDRNGDRRNWRVTDAVEAAKRFVAENS